MLGTSRTLECPVDGNPDPNITWYKGNDTSGATVLFSGKYWSLSPTGLNDSGWNSCFAENFLGNDTALFEVHVGKLRVSVVYLPNTLRPQSPSLKWWLVCMSMRCLYTRGFEDNPFLRVRVT